jgi:hypothetical protein
MSGFADKLVARLHNTVGERPFARRTATGTEKGFGGWMVSQAVKSVHARHRLLLSGTPLQNNVLELWSLFDFLMPSFLGTERQFYATYGTRRPCSLAALWLGTETPTRSL